MLLIIVGHIWSLSDLSVFYVWLFAFHVQIFFFTSGLTFKPEAQTWITLARKRFPSLILPFWVFALLGYGFYLAGYVVAQTLHLNVPQFGYGLLTPLLGALYGTVGDGWLVNSPVWFLPALFLALLMVQATHQFSQRLSVQYAVLLALFALGSAIGESVRLPWSLASALCGALFLHIGWHFQQQQLWSRLSRRSWLGIGLACGLLSLWSHINGGVGLAGPTVNHPALFLIFTASGLGLSLGLIAWLGKRVSVLDFLGRHSMGLLVLHMLVIKGVKVILSFVFGLSISHMEHDWAWGLAVLALSALLLWPSVGILEKHFPTLLGIQKSLRKTPQA